MNSLSYKRAENDFYQAAQNGDHVVITDKRAILYDPRQDKIIDVLPVKDTALPAN